MRIFIIVLFLYTNVFANNLEEWILSIQNETNTSKIAEIPKIKHISIMESTPFFVNIFSANRFSDGKMEFELDKLVMVGYLSFKNKDYAFIQTPYDTKKLMVGESIGQASVLQIGKNFVVLSELQQMNGHIFNNKVYLKLAVESKD